MLYEQAIRQWFDKEGGGSLLLPDGWFGRPHDNVHSLTSIDEAKDVLIIVLDQGRITLQFERPKMVRVDNHDLIFSEFDKFCFEWKGIGTRGGTKNYHEGEVRLVAHALTRTEG